MIEEIDIITSMDLIVPCLISLYEKDEVIIPIVLINNGERNLTDTILSYEISDLDLSLGHYREKIKKIDVDKHFDSEIQIQSRANLGAYKIIVTATNGNLSISEEISVRVIERGLENKTKAEQSLEFVNKIFEENPECNIIHEMVVKAEESLVDREYEKVESFATSALESCKDILSGSRKSIERPAGVFLGRGDIIIISLSIVMILLVIILKIVTDVVRSRKKKQVGKKKK